MSTIRSSCPPTRAPTAHLQKDRAHVDPVLGRGTLGVPQERGVHTGVAKRERLAVDPDRPVPERPDEVVGGILRVEQVAVVLPLVEVGDRDERLDRTVAGARTVAGERRIHPGHALLDGDDGVGDGQRQVLVGVDAELRGRVKDVAVGAERGRATPSIVSRPPESVTYTQWAP